jgi:hypothetical protein
MTISTLARLLRQHQFEFRRQHDRQVVELFALQNPADVDARLAVSIRPVPSIADRAVASGNLEENKVDGFRIP